MKIMILMQLLFLILTGCSAKEKTIILKTKKPMFKCNKDIKINAINYDKYNYLIKKNEFEKLAIGYSKCIKACEYCNKVINK